MQNTFKKLLTLPILTSIAGIIAICVWLYLDRTNALDVPLDTPRHTLRTYIKPNKPLVVIFWASWCGHCMHEVKVLNQLKNKYPNLDIIGLQVDDGIPGSIFQTAQYPSISARQNGNTIMSKYGNYGLGVPFLLVLSQNGNKSQTLTGETDINTLEQTIFNTTPLKD